jgi:hypothetical protein
MYILFPQGYPENICGRRLLSRCHKIKIFDWMAEILTNQRALFCDVGTAAVIPHAVTFTLWCCPVFRVMKHNMQIVTWLFRNVLTKSNFEPWHRRNTCLFIQKFQSNIWNLFPSFPLFCSGEQKRGNDGKRFQILLWNFWINKQVFRRCICPI